MLPLVSFGIVNCNRLYYLKSCFESLVVCTDDYENREFIIVDNASVESGTKEYLDELENRGVKVIRNTGRDEANEFAKGLNIICKEAKGEFVCPLQGDMQFIVKDKWLEKYVKFIQQNEENVGCITLDAQRNVTNYSQSSKMTIASIDEFKFVANKDRTPIAGAADVFYSRKIIDLIFPWDENNENHEGTQDSETSMLNKVKQIVSERDLHLICYMPILPVAITIYTDPRGTNARIRGNKRYGKYVAPASHFTYYALVKYDDAIVVCESRTIPVPIEEIACPIGWEKMLDSDGNWLKNPIRPETALPSDYEEINKSIIDMQNEKHVDDWLNT